MVINVQEKDISVFFVFFKITISMIYHLCVNKT